MKRIEYEDRNVKIIRREDGSLTWDDLGRGYTLTQLEERLSREIANHETRGQELRDLHVAIVALKGERDV